jgi:Ca-activated chloride channel family protein
MGGRRRITQSDEDKTMNRISKDDPRVTAYALGELEGDELALVAAAVQADAELQAVVAEIRATAGALEQALAGEPAPELPAKAPAKKPAKKPGRLLAFPQLYYVIGGAAAACFTFLVVLQEPLPKQAAPAPVASLAQEKQYVEMSLNAPKEAEEEVEASADALSLPAPSAVALAPRASAVAAMPQKSDVRGLAKKRQAAPAVKGEWLACEPAPVAPAFNTEDYSYQRDNDFVAVATEPLSTFSIDVDTASYANVRRFLNEGQRPPRDAVRVEELVNYFPYRYAAPTGKDVPVAAHLEVAEAPWAPAHRLVRIGLKAREVAEASRPSANLVFLLDVSGSMEDANKLPLVKQSMQMLVNRLRPDDRVAIVTYAGASGLALPSTPVSRASEILGALDRLTSGGSTNGAMGIQLAYDIAKANFVAGGVNRVILCTDGDFNVGTTSEGELVRLIEEKAKGGTFLTVLGFGMGNYKDGTLEKLADKGNGNYGYVDSAAEARRLLVEQAGGTLVTVAKDVKVQVEFNPACVAAYRLVGYENRLLRKEDFANDKIDAGDMGSGHTVTALYEVVPVGEGDAATLSGPGVEPLKYQRPAGSTIAASGSPELLSVKVRYKEPAGQESRRLEFPLVDRGATWALASEDFKFAASVAAFGMVLRESPHRGTATLVEVRRWAADGMAADAGGYRQEFLGLVDRAATVMR